MRKTMRKIFISFLLAVFIFTFVGMPASDQQLTQVQASSTLSGKVSSSVLNIRKSKSTSAKKLKTLKKGTKVTVLESGSTWVKVSVNGVVGYTKGKYIKTSYGTASKPYNDSITGKVSSKVLAVRTSKSSSATKLMTLTKGASVRVLTTNSTWVKIYVNGIVGYVKGKCVKTADGTAASSSGKGSSVVAYAKRFLGNPYVYGGSSLTHGTDCSGFVMSIYKHFGINLPHSSYALRHVGRAVKGGIKNAKPGDIICYSGHVAIYMGNNRVIHASNPKSGIKITNNASYRHIVAIRRIF